MVFALMVPVLIALDEHPATYILSLSYFLRIFESGVFFKGSWNLGFFLKKYFKCGSDHLRTFYRIVLSDWFSKTIINILFPGANFLFILHFTPRWAHFPYNINVIKMPKIPHSVSLVLMFEPYVQLPTWHFQLPDPWPSQV